MQATTSEFMALCLNSFLEPDADLVLIEYNTNDAAAIQDEQEEGGKGHGNVSSRSRSDTAGLGRRRQQQQCAQRGVTASMERLVRRVLALPHRPAVVLMQAPAKGAAQDCAAAAGGGGAPGLAGADFRRFDQTAEDSTGVLAQYYGLSYVSLRTALHRLAALKHQPGFRWHELFVDAHPGDSGHKAFADVAVYLLQQTLLDLASERPLGPEDGQMLREPLPPPILPGNEAHPRSSCVLDPGLQHALLAAEGWRYVNEGSTARPKRGFVARQPGSQLTLAVELGVAAPLAVPVFVLHLKSYDSMGRAAVRCDAGCACEEAVIDGFHGVQVSQTYLSQPLMVRALAPPGTGGSACHLQFEVLGESSSGRFKFKVSGIIVGAPGTLGLANLADGWLPHFGVP